MKFVRSKKNEHGVAGAYVFNLSKRDRNLLLSILKLYPATDARHHRLSNEGGAELKAGQPLLIEAMEEQRRGHATKIDRLLKNEGQFFRGSEDAPQLALTGEQMEWLLQALNDVRVGSWMRLGCPEMAEARRAVLTKENAAHYTAMEVSGYFQSALLEAFGADEG